MTFVIRGVEMFLGLEPEDAGDGGSCPLRRITHLCGLTLGGDYAFDDGAEVSGDADNRLQRRAGPRLATVLGQVVDGLDQAEQLLDHAQDLDVERSAGR